jgi:predicted nucleic acid-binding protein
VTAAYLDSSFLLAILFAEPRSGTLRRILARFDRVFSSDLLVADCLSAATRERVDPNAALVALRSVSVVLPPRSLEAEVLEASAHGYLRGADLWHVACALFLADAARTEFAFLSRDKAQRKVAGRLGFSTP